MATLMVHRNIFKNFGKLPMKVQKKVSEFVDIFQEDPTALSIGLHPLDSMMADPKVRGAKLSDDYRAIIIAPEKGDTYLLIYIDHHDEAYAWAKNKHFEVHQMTGMFQVFDVQEVESVAHEQNEIHFQSSDEYPLSKLSEDELYHAGVPTPLIPAVSAVRNDEALLALVDYLPSDCRDILMGIASGMTVDEALDEMLGLTESQPTETIPENTGDFSNVRNTSNFDLVLVEGEEHLKDILSASLEEWRLFLHPYQRKLVQWDVKGPMNINGAAGTGKTVVLMHRAVYLARNLQALKDRILVTTFTTNLSVTLKGQIQRLDPVVADKIEITNLHALARTICSRSGWKGRIANDEIDEIWENVWLDSSLGELPMSREELKEEYFQVIDPNGIEDKDSYLTTIRSGRPRITRQQRMQAWSVFRAFQRELKKRNLLTFEGAIHQARLAVEQGNFYKYRYVLVDEVQDFSLEALRLIRAISPIEEELSNPLCTVGDGHQRIYRAKIPMSRAGIQIVGRSRRLKINYRTSEQIRQFAQGLLQGMEIDDLDGKIVSIVGDHSVFKGPSPIIEHYQDNNKEAEDIVAWVQVLLEDHGLKNHEICITPYSKKIRESLTAADIPTYELRAREADPGSNEPGVRMGTMKRIKGLEFRAIAMICSHEEDPMNHMEQAEALARCERYVAATRAREHLLITLAKS